VDKIETSAPLYNPVSYSGIKPEPKKTQNKNGVKPKSLFFSFLEQANEESEVSALQKLPVTEETIKQLLDDIHSSGDELKNHPLPAEILRYKQAVKNFLNFIVQNTYDIEKQYTGSLRKRKEKTLIQVVDQKLDQLAAGILAGQSGQLEILQRLEEITGILVDLLQ
jgi:uncharacterized protein YaaR (DUF327 family)